MERLLYLGCMVYNRFPDYELSAKAVLSRIGFRLRDFHEFACCSSTFIPSLSDDWIYLAAYNLALAEKRGMDIISLCGTCTSTLKRTNLVLQDEGLLRKVNSRLNEVGLSYSGGVRVNHLLEVLREKEEEIGALVTHPLRLKVALQHPCNVFRPSEVARFDSPSSPKAMREIAVLTGAEVVDYAGEYECCGSTLLLTSEALGISAGSNKLASARKAGAQAMVVACGNCAYLFDRYKERMKKSMDTELPTLFLTQLLGLAFGLGRKELGLNIRRVELG
ncbi:CoB--CoM heterodisulfide reductase iron-sulfur subunit B family protein [Candidatus Pyrohabitans sp.]